MKVWILGDFSDDLDEGFKNVSHYLSGELQKLVEVTRINIKTVPSRTLWQEYSNQSPQIVHSITGPTISSLLATSLLGRLMPKSRKIISALRPCASFRRPACRFLNKFLLRRFSPNLFLSQEREFSDLCHSIHIPVKFLPNGVDAERFKPVSVAKKVGLRKKHGFALEKPLILHVGHLEKARNLAALECLPAAGFQVCVVGSLYPEEDTQLTDSLREKGIRVERGYRKDVPEFYQMADLYLFPVYPGNSLSMPLSILEAMACNLPVLTSPFPGIVKSFPEGCGLKYIENLDRLIPDVYRLLASPPQTRSMVADLSWQSVALRLMDIYRELLMK